MHLYSRECRNCNWTFEGGRVIIYPKEVQGPPPSSGVVTYKPPEWAVVVLACPQCGAPMTFDLRVELPKIAGVRQLLDPKGETKP
jgi:hypothetical protein